MSGVDPWILVLINVLSVVFWGGLLVMVVRHLSRGEREARGRDADALRDAIDGLEADRDRLARRVESLEAIVTSDGFDLEREAHAVGISGSSSGIDPVHLDVDLPPETYVGNRRRDWSDRRA